MARPNDSASIDLVLVAIVVLAAVLRLHGLTAESIDLDETFSLQAASRSLGDLLLHNVDHANPPLYFILLKGFIALFGAGEAALRAPSVIFGVAGVCALYFLALDLHGRAVARLATLLCAVSWTHVAHSQNARAYALAMFLAVCATRALWRALARGASFSAYVVLAAALAYTHYFGLIVILAHGLAVAVARGARCLQLDRRALAAALLLGAALAPIVPLYLFQGGFLSATSRSFWQPHVSLDRLASLASAWIGRAGLVRYGTTSMALGLLVPAIFAVLARKKRSAAATLLHLGTLYGSLLVFIVLSTLKPVWQPRYVSLVLPLFLLGLVLWRRAIAVLFVLLAVVGLALGKRAPTLHQDWRGAAQFVKAHAATSRPLFVLGPPYLAPPLRYYYDGPFEVVPNRELLVKRVTRAAASGPVFVFYSDAHHPPDPRRETAVTLAKKLGLRAVAHLRYLHVYELGPPGPR